MGHEQPWLKFYPRDWRGDQALRVCSLAARGLWIEMLCVMHEAEPYGHLLVNGRPVTDAQLASLCGVSPDQLTNLLTELENAGAYSKNAKGTIYSRRMTRDAKKAKTAQQNGRHGGNPTLNKQTENPASDKGDLKAPDKPGDKLRDQKPEAISRKNSKEVLEGLTKGLTGQKQKTKEEIKILWQTGILNEARRRLADDAYAAFVDAWANDDQKAQKFADLLDRDIRARKRRAA